MMSRDVTSAGDHMQEVEKEEDQHSGQESWSCKFVRTVAMVMAWICMVSLPILITGQFKGGSGFCLVTMVIVW